MMLLLKLKMSVAPEKRKPMAKVKPTHFNLLIDSDSSLDLDSEASSHLEIAEEFEGIKKTFAV